MNADLRTGFEERWKKYFKDSPLPIVFFYTDTLHDAEYVERTPGHHCLIGDLAKVRKGISIAFDSNSIGCNGGKRYLGFSDSVRPDFAYFLSCGIPGKMEGERYIRTPEQVNALVNEMPPILTGKKYIVFRRWDRITPGDDPQAVIFFAGADILSGLFTLVNYDHAHGDGVIAPFGAGCASIVYHPLAENRKENPKAVIGMFDVSARPYVPPDILTIAIPMKRFIPMVSYMDESFLVTGSWNKVMKRLS